MKGILLFTLMISGFLTNQISAEPPGEKKTLILPIIANSSFSDPSPYTTVVSILAASGPKNIHFAGFGSGPGGRINVGCTIPIISNEWLVSGKDGWEGIWNHDICGTKNPDREFGWILVTEYIPSGLETDIRYAANIYQSSRDPSKILSLTSVPAVVPRKNFLVPSMYTPDFPKLPVTSYAIVNPSEDKTAFVDLHAGRSHSDLDQPECRITISIPPLQRISKFINELVPRCEHVDETMKITSDVPIAVAAMLVHFPDYRFVSLPVIELEDQ